MKKKRRSIEMIKARHERGCRQAYRDGRVSEKWLESMGYKPEQA